MKYVKSISQGRVPSIVINNGYGQTIDKTVECHRIFKILTFVRDGYGSLRKDCISEDTVKTDVKDNK